MDFLLLLPHGHRVVLEVDGAHHLRPDGRPDPAGTPPGCARDRDLKLAGYEVFRFGATELQTRAPPQPAPEVLHRPVPAFGVTSGTG